MSFDARQRQSLFIDLAGRAEGTTAQSVYEAGREKGDSVSQEAYFNLGRRLTHRGLLKADRTGDRTVYFSNVDEDSTWIDEDRLAAMIDPEYPIIGLTVYRESQRQARSIPQEVWLEARERLCHADARTLFLEAIIGYADNFCDEIESYATERKHAANAPGLNEMRKRAESDLFLLEGLCRNGLGLSREAIRLPVSVDVAAETFLKEGSQGLYDRDVLIDELSRRVEAGTLIREAAHPEVGRELVVAGVDGSTMGGLLSLDALAGDFAFGHAPQVSINTATGILNRDVRLGGRRAPVFLRLPEKPEDMQRSDNRYTIMAKMLFPDLTEAQYVHSTWNAMDLLECRATLALMGRWTLRDGNIEIPPADVVLRDGTIVPNDRDPNHYGEQSSYGRICRDLIEANWKIARTCKDEPQSVLGVVKNAQLRVFAPVVNYFLRGVASRDGDTQIKHWSLFEMNALFDQSIMTRLLTAGRKQDDPWMRTAIVLRPFHATSNLGKVYSRTTGKRPDDMLIARSKKARNKPLEEITQEDDWWRQELRVPGDPYLQMLRNVSYAGFYVGACREVDRSEQLTRMEFMVVSSTEEQGGFPQEAIDDHLNRTMVALRKVGFDVAKEHAMYDAAGHIDLLPKLLIRAHDTVKHWAKELRDRVSEYMDWQLVKYLKSSERRSVRLRPWTRREFQAWSDAMQRERRLAGGDGDSHAD